MSVRLYVGNLPKEEVDRQELQAIFGDAGDSISTKVIKDRKTGQCRGFAFVTVKTDEQADEIIEKFNGYAFKETTLKIEKALPRAKNEGEEESQPAASTATPTPSTTPRSSANTPPSSGGGGGRRSNKKQPRRTATSTPSSDPEAIQPDPRWATELAKLKELLAAQTSNS